MALTLKTDVHETIERVEASDAFIAFNAENPHHYLVHAFATVRSLDPAVPLPPLELGYYGKEHDMITVFTSEPVAARPPEEVFKEEGSIAGLDLLALRQGFADALRIVERTRSSQYPAHAAMQGFCILQQNRVYSTPVWNITLVLNTLSMLNMKIDAVTGEVLSRELQNIMSLSAEQS
ncbi:TPA: hypothetical protein HA251_08810 [Candidatus Woesearchaeota archaeon]|nr:hypothetical protein [Candidatus Woesearchaeota archaeon]